MLNTRSFLRIDDFSKGSVNNEQIRQGIEAVLTNLDLQNDKNALQELDSLKFIELVSEVESYFGLGVERVPLCVIFTKKIRYDLDDRKAFSAESSRDLEPLVYEQLSRMGRAEDSTYQ